MKIIIIGIIAVVVIGLSVLGGCIIKIALEDLYNSG